MVTSRTSPGLEEDIPIQEAQQVQEHDNGHDMPIQLGHQLLLDRRIEIMMEHLFSLLMLMLLFFLERRRLGPISSC